MPPQDNSRNSSVWILTAQSSEVASLGELTLLANPYRIGRRHNVELPIHEKLVSGHHATLFEVRGKLYLEDMESRNGTFVNGDRINGKVEVHEGDLIQFAQSVFRLGRDEIVEELSFGETMVNASFDNAQMIIDFENIMLDREFEPHLQSIVDLSTYETIGFEVLVRSKHRELRSPAKLFATAEKMQRESELSELIRRVAAQEFHEARDKIVADGKKLFLNTHPNELHDTQRLIYSMEKIRNEYDDLPLVLEIHESAVTDMEEMSKLCIAISEMGFEIAYDDFGAGQARFFELIEEPPAFLKFDIRLVRDIHQANQRRRQAIAQLVKMVNSLDIICIAEGIEVREDAGVCQELGFDLAQGYYFSRPDSIQSWIAKSNQDVLTT